MMRSSPPLAASRLLRCSARRVVISLLVHRRQKPIERRLRQQQAQEQPEQTIETWRADFFAAGRLIAGRAARRRRQCRASPRSGRAVAESGCAHRSADRTAWSRARPAAVAAAPTGRPRGGVDLGVNRGAKSRNRHEAGEIGQLAGGDERQQHRREAASAPRRRSRRGGTADSTGRGTPPRGSPTCRLRSSSPLSGPYQLK